MTPIQVGNHGDLVTAVRTLAISLPFCASAPAARRDHCCCRRRLSPPQSAIAVAASFSLLPQPLLLLLLTLLPLTLLLLLPLLPLLPLLLVLLLLCRYRRRHCREGGHYGHSQTRWDRTLWCHGRTDGERQLFG